MAKPFDELRKDMSPERREANERRAQELARDWRRKRLIEAIDEELWTALQMYRCSETIEDDAASGLPLVDKLCAPESESVATGESEMRLLHEALAVAVLGAFKQHPGSGGSADAEGAVADPMSAPGADVLANQLECEHTEGFAGILLPGASRCPECGLGLNTYTRLCEIAPAPHGAEQDQSIDRNGELFDCGAGHMLTGLEDNGACPYCEPQPEEQE